MRYTESELISLFLRDKKAKTSKAGKLNLYKSSAINYISLAKDGDRLPATEVIAGWVVRNFEEYFSKMYFCRRADSIRTNGYVYRQVDKKGNDKHKTTLPRGNSTREEERIAITLKGSIIPGFGKVLDYQIPLKSASKDTVGKIDLISYDPDCRRLYLMELKRPGSKETLLRCLLEAFAYSRSFDKRCFAEEYGVDPNAQLVIAPMFFKGSRPDLDRQEMLEGKRPMLEALEKRLKGCENGAGDFRVDDVSYVRLSFIAGVAN